MDYLQKKNEFSTLLDSDALERLEKHFGPDLSLNLALAIILSQDMAETVEKYGLLNGRNYKDNGAVRNMLKRMRARNVLSYSTDRRNKSFVDLRQEFWCIAFPKKEDRLKFCVDEIVSKLAVNKI